MGNGQVTLIFANYDIYERQMVPQNIQQILKANALPCATLN